TLPPKDVRLLRSVLARELETINEYEVMAGEAEDPHIRDFFLHLAEEEKEHVGEAMALINERDPDQKRELDEADTRPEHFLLGETRAASSVTSLQRSPPASASQLTPAQSTSGARPLPFTVGSLRGQPCD